MRCLILIALCCVALASANYVTKNRFYNLLRSYQKPEWYLKDDLLGRNWYGYDFTDDEYLRDFDYDDIRRDNFWGLKRGLGLDNMWDDDFDLKDLDYDTLRRGDLGFDDTLRRGDFEFDDTLRRDGLTDLDEDWTRRGDYDDLLRRDIIYGDDDLLGSGFGLIKEVEDANCKLASRLYKQTKDDKDDKNTVVSPISIQLALAALNKGARRNTKRQIGRVIGGGMHEQERREIFKKLVRHFKGLRRGDIDILGRFTKINPVTLIAINKRTPAQQWFIELCTGQLDARVKHFDFNRRCHESRQLINSWVSRKTNMKINQILPRDAITDNTKMVLVNAMELKATWGNQMRHHVTKEAKFYPLDTKKVKICEVMETQGRFKYYEDELVKIVGIPTKEKELTFYMIVPKYKDGLTEVEKLHLKDGVQLKKLLDKTDIHYRHVGVQLPKFQIKHKIDVRRTLRKEGVTDAFDPLRADFSGITGMDKFGYMDEIEGRFDDRVDRLGYSDVMDKFGMFGGLKDEKLHLNKFIHQSTIKITENGITGATDLETMYDDVTRFDRRMDRGLFGLDELTEDRYDEMTSLFHGDFMGKKMVKGNRAFAFAIKHNPTKQLLMVGRVIDAAQKKVNDVFDYQNINTIDLL